MDPRPLDRRERRTHELMARPIPQQWMRAPRKGKPAKRGKHGSVVPIMALVYRNGRPRYQRSVRRGGRVTTEYVGSGNFAILKALFDAEDRDALEEARQRARAEQQRLDDLEHDLDELAEQARALAHEALTAAGYHQHHRGQWRKRR